MNGHKRSGHTPPGVLVLLTVLCIASAGTSVFALLRGLKTPEVKSEDLRARRFIVVDDANIERAVLGTATDGSVFLSVPNRQKTAITWVGVLPDGEPRVAIVDTQGRPHIEMTLFRGSPRLALRVPGAGTRLGMLLADEGAPRIDFLGKSGKVACSLAADFLRFISPEGETIHEIPPP